MSSAKSGRKVFIGGNWKCNGTRAVVDSLVNKLNSLASTLPPSNLVEVVVSPINVHIDRVQTSLQKHYKVAAQNLSPFPQGAYTGEISADQLVDIGINWVIIGHSERRQFFGATDAVVAKQVGLALKSNLNVIACIGETLEERKANKTIDVVSRQLKAIADVVGDKWQNVVIAYEPVWAIGTGVVATPAQAQEVHAAIRQFLSAKYSPAVAKSTRIIYGGSVKGNNADELITQTDIDGFLVGGASLNGEEFVRIAQSPIKAKL